MRALVCELCGGNDFVKEGDFYVCQNCGTKFTTEDARRMMIEGTVAVQGTVNIDNSSYVERYLQNARRAMQKEDWEETEKYYNLVEQNDPTNIEAIFYSAYAKAKSTLISNDIYKREAAFNSLKKSVSILDDNFSMSNEAENKLMIEQISNDILALACSSYVYTQKKNGYGITVSDDSHKTIELFNELGKEFTTTLELIARKYPESQKQGRIFYYNLCIKHAEFIISNGRLTTSQGWRTALLQYHNMIHEIDPSHEVPESAQNVTGSSYKGPNSAGKVFLVIVVVLYIVGMCILLSNIH